MEKKDIERNLIQFGLAIGAIVGLIWLFYPAKTTFLKERIPGEDRIVEGGSNVLENVWAGDLEKSNGAPAKLTGKWPCFRGPNRDNISVDPTPLAKKWPENGPKLLWKLRVGEGFAGASIWNGRVFLLDYDQANQKDVLRCLSLENASEIWRYAYKVKVKRNHGMSRTVPAVTEKYVVSLGPKCHVLCVDTETGEHKWHIDLVREFNAEVPPWYAGQCPLIDGDSAIIASGGDVLIISIDCSTGSIRWKSPNPHMWQMTHSSILKMEYLGKKMYVYCASGGVVGVDANSGKILWETDKWKINIANIPMPIHVGDGKIFLSGGYDAGSMMIQLQQAGDNFEVKELFRLKPSVFGAVQQTPIFWKDHIFGVRPDGQFVCLDLNGKLIWSSGPSAKFGSGPFLLAQNMFFAMNDNGLLSLIDASTSDFKLISQAKVLEGPDSWAPMALADGLLVLRDLNWMICLDVSAKAQ
jgi:outer membrane protein assembly factor BamB